MTTTPPPQDYSSNKDSLDEILNKDRLTDVYGKNEQVIMVDGDLNSATPLKTALQHLLAKERINELERLKKIDAFNEPYTTDPRPAKLVSIRIAQLKQQIGGEL